MSVTREELETELHKIRMQMIDILKLHDSFQNIMLINMRTQENIAKKMNVITATLHDNGIDISPELRKALNEIDEDVEAIRIEARAHIEMLQKKSNVP